MFFVSQLLNKNLWTSWFFYRTPGLCIVEASRQLLHKHKYCTTSWNNCLRWMAANGDMLRNLKLIHLLCCVARVFKGLAAKKTIYQKKNPNRLKLYSINFLHFLEHFHSCITKMVICMSTRTAQLLNCTITIVTIPSCKVCWLAHLPINVIFPRLKI